MSCRSLLALTLLGIIIMGERTTGYPPRFGPYPYYDANYVYGIDGYAGYYDGWRTRPADYLGDCKILIERRIFRRGRAMIEVTCAK